MVGDHVKILTKMDNLHWGDLVFWEHDGSMPVT